MPALNELRGHRHQRDFSHRYDVFFLRRICQRIGKNIDGAFYSFSYWFFLLYKLFHFIVNPFESDDDDKKKKWNFGFPAALISLLFALCFVYFVVNRLRTTDELNKLSELMEKGISEKTNDTGIGSFIIEKISANPIGSLIFNIFHNRK